MSDELTHPRVPAAHEPTDRPQGRPGWGAPAVQGATIVVLFVVVGAFCGWLWERLWTPATGLVWQGQWHKGLIALDPKTFAQAWSENAHQDVFSGTAIYTVIGIVAGLAVGAFAAFLLDAAELVTLGALIVGGLLAGLVAQRVGLHLSAPSPDALAPTTPNGAVLDDRIHLAGWGLWGVFPGAALIPLAMVFLIFDRPRRAEGPSEPIVPPAEVSGRSEP